MNEIADELIKYRMQITTTRREMDRKLVDKEKELLLHV
jgi:hypothetical protein